jgi:UDP-glucose 4-epimerase
MSDIDECIENPKTAIKVNILGNVNVMNSCVKHNVKRFVFASSAYAGGNHGGIYTTTKKSNEMLVRDYHKFYGLNYTVLRYGTLYGVGAPPTNSICKYLTQVVKEKKIDYTGDGTEVREYIHVEDASKMSFDILESKNYLSTIVSLTGPNPTKTQDLFTMIEEIMNGEVEINFNKNLTKGRTAAHYRVSPYTYERDKVYKMNLDINRDLGDTLIEILYDLND